MWSYSAISLWGGYLQNSGFLLNREYLSIWFNFKININLTCAGGSYFCICQFWVKRCAFTSAPVFRGPVGCALSSNVACMYNLCWRATKWQDWLKSNEKQSFKKAQIFVLLWTSTAIQHWACTFRGNIAVLLTSCCVMGHLSIPLGSLLQLSLGMPLSGLG